MLLLGPNWRTTVGGWTSAASAFVLFAANPPFSIHWPAWLSALATFSMVGGLAAVGMAAKDRNVTGGSVSQPGIPVAPVPEQPVVVVAASSLPKSAILTEEKKG